jgi:5-methyltetrahydropteroyltriglutamate--homocysteine methyltransferase
MRRSSDERFLTTHAGSLPAPEPGEGDDIPAQVRAVVGRQRAAGLDLLNEGEYTKGGDWLSFADDRFSGFQERPPSGEPRLIERGEDRRTFAGFYRYATERQILFYQPDDATPTRRARLVCTGPIAYSGEAQLAREIAALRDADPGEDAFLTSTAPASLEVYRENEYYESEEAYLYALAEALRVEYAQIVEAGFVLQVDDAWLPALWDRIGIEMGLDAFLDRCRLRIEVLNHALRDLPEDRIRYHMCWGSWHGPHAFDIELAQMLPLLLEVHAQAYLIEAGNVRHEHEWAVWRDTPLPDGKILVPGVVSHATDVVEHPDLVAQRLRRFADVVGAENVIGGTDCGLGGRCHPEIAWAKLAALAEGARRAGG